MKFAEIKPKEVLSTSMYLTVLKKEGDAIHVKDNYGREFQVKGKKLVEETMNSARQYDSSVLLSQTKLAEVLVNAGETAFTAVFDKKDGQERTMVAKLMDTENHMGRSNVIDLEITSGSPARQIDHRTLKQVILKNVRYYVK